MIFPKIKESIKNSEFFRKNNIIPIEFNSNYKKIKNNYIESKKEIKNKLKGDLVNFIDCFLMYNVDEECIEDYVLDLINEFGFDDINNLILNSNDHIINKVENLNPIRLLKNDANNENFIYNHCTPEYYIKNINKLDKNKLKNRHMNKFFNNLNNYLDLLKSKINFEIDITKHKYFNWIKNSTENLNKLFIDAIENNNIKCAKKLLENGADIHTDGEYALKWSSENGNIDLVKFLIEKGANIHVRDDEALRMSSLNGHVEVVKFLIENGANIHADADYALKMSSRNGHIEVVKFLVEKGANIHEGNDDALGMSSRNGHIEVVKYLIEKGADIHANDDHAIIMSSQFGRIEVVKYLIENGANIHVNNDCALRWSSFYGHIDVVKYLIQNGANIHAWDDYALRMSSSNEHIEVIKFLIQSDINYFRDNQMVIPIIQRHGLNNFFNNLINNE